jgi:hypothetical protein
MRIDWVGSRKVQVVDLFEAVQFMQGKTLAARKDNPFYGVQWIAFTDGTEVGCYSRCDVSSYTDTTPDIDAEAPDFYIYDPLV